MSGGRRRAFAATKPPALERALGFGAGRRLLSPTSASRGVDADGEAAARPAGPSRALTGARSPTGARRRRRRAEAP